MAQILRAHGAVNIEERAAAYQQEDVAGQGPDDLSGREDQTGKPAL